MTTACGAGALIQNVDYRIGLQLGKNDDIICRRFLRNQGWFPVDYVVRELDKDTDEPIDYRLEMGFDKLDVVEQGWYSKLPATFSTKDARALTKKGSSSANNWLKQVIALDLIRKLDRGLWQKLPQSVAQTEQYN